MKYSVAAVVLAAATSVSAWSNDTIVYTTEIVDVYTTVCPASATITYNGETYTNTLTESSTIVITNCPCTISKPVYTTSAVVAPSAPAVSVPAVSAPAAPVYPNATTPAPGAPTSVASGGVVGTTYVPSSPSATIIPASGANKAFAMSGASLAGLLGLAAYIL